MPDKKTDRTKGQKTFFCMSGFSYIGQNTQIEKENIHQNSLVCLTILNENDIIYYYKKSP